MENRIIGIGNSKGIIIPAALLKQLGLQKGSIVNIGLKDNCIVIKPGKRADWAQAARLMNAKGEDRMLGSEPAEAMEEIPW